MRNELKADTRREARTELMGSLPVTVSAMAIGVAISVSGIATTLQFISELRLAARTASCTALAHVDRLSCLSSWNVGTISIDAKRGFLDHLPV